jgi:outer membrane protein
MNRLRAVVLLLSFLTLPIASRGQVPPSQNIVTVSFNAAVIQTAEAQKELGTLEAKLAPRQAQLKALNDEVEALRKQIGNPNDKLSDTERETREQTLDKKEKQLQRQAEDFRNDSQSESQQVFQTVAQKLYAFLQTYAQQHGYSAVIERGSDAAPVVWYAASNLDITDQLIKAYNAQASAASSGSPAKPAKNLPETPSPHP